MPDVKKRLLPREGLRGSGMIDSIIEASDAESLVTRFFWHATVEDARIDDRDNRENPVFVVVSACR
jgi:hypothetical protein